MPATAMSDSVALPLSLPGVQARALRIPRRPLKLFGAASLLCAGAYGVLGEQQNVASSDAVVSAYVLDLRSPTEGTLSGITRAAGSSVAPGDLLARVDDPLAGHDHRDNLQTVLDTATAAAEADARELAVLATLRTHLLTRADAHAHAVSARLAQAVAEQDALCAGAELAARQAATEFERGRQLHAAGIIAAADFEKLSSTEAIAQQRLAAAHAASASLRDQHAAAQAGLLAEPGTNNDVAYSRQRADELDLKLAETQRSFAATRMEARQAETALAAERTRSGHMAQAELRSPITGRVWQVHAFDGERAGTGDAVVSLVDCRAQFLLVDVPQDRLPGVAVGGSAQYKLAGDSTPRSGLVLAVSGTAEDNHKFAATPVRDAADQHATVRVALDPATPCSMGRTARVLLPTQPANRLTRLLREYF